MTEKMKTVCAGRFLIDLPEAAQVFRRGAFVQGFDIKVSTEGAEAFQERVSAREAAINAEKNQYGRSSMESINKVDINGFTGKTFVFGRNSTYVLHFDQRIELEGVAIEGYVHSNGTSFDFIASDYDPKLVRNLAQLISQLRLVADGVIPKAPGFCFGRGLFLDPLMADDGESLRVSATIPGHADLSIAFSTMAGLERNGPGLLERNARSVAREPLWMRAAFTTLREGKREINTLRGEELGFRVREVNFSTVYGFDWELHGTETDVFAPFIHLELATGRNPQAGGEPVQSSLAQDAVQDLWDKISSSIRIRPTDDTPAVKPAVLPTAPIGASATAGDSCPQSGWWKCKTGDNGTGVLGGKVQYFKLGQPMPQALLLPKQTLWEKLRGIQASYESDSPTAWALVDKRAQSRSTPRVPLAPATDVASADAMRPDAASASRQAVTVGSLVKTGAPCSASGWWRCVEPQALDGTRWFAKDSFLPAATFHLPPRGGAKANKVPSVIQRRSAWQLVRHADAPEPAGQNGDGGAINNVGNCNTQLGQTPPESSKK